MRTIIAGGTVVSPAGMQRADVVCEGGRIVELASARAWDDGSKVIDVTGQYVLPGFIDPHVHSRDPGMTEKEDFRHATLAAAAGGITTILEMPNAVPGITDVAIFRRRVVAHSAVAHVDFGLWGLTVSPRDCAAIPDLAAAGAVGLKVFWGYYFDVDSGRLIHTAPDVDQAVVEPASNGDMWEILAAAARSSIPVAVHCEDRAILDAAAKDGPPATDYERLLGVRPAVAESIAVAAVIELAQATDALVHVVHVSTSRAVALLRQAKADGIGVTSETCPHYLMLTAQDFASVGPAMKVYPPVRHQADQDALWDAVIDGTLTFVASDHAPHSQSDRARPFENQPAGAPGVETMARLMLDQVARGRITLPRLAAILSTNAALTFGLYPRKGVIQPGADADLTVVDLSRPWAIRNESLHSKSRVSPWHGRVGVGSPTITIVRGHVVAIDGIPIGEPIGRFVPARSRSAEADQPQKRRVTS